MAVSPAEAGKIFLSALSMIRNITEDFYDPRLVARQLFQTLKGEGLPYSYNDVWSSVSAASRAFDRAMSENAGTATGRSPTAPQMSAAQGESGQYAYRVIVSVQEADGHRHETAVTVTSSEPLGQSDIKARAGDIVLQDSSLNTKYERVYIGVVAGTYSAVTVASYRVE